MPVSADPSIEMQEKSEKKRTLSSSHDCKWFDFPEQVAGQDGFGDRARQVQQAFGHHPGPGRELNVVNSVGVVGGAEVDDVQALGNHPTKTEPKNESLID